MGFPCGEHGACSVDDSGAPGCGCESGFGGPYCEVNEDDCAGVVCPGPGQVCQDGVRSYTCVCPPGIHFISMSPSLLTRWWQLEGTAGA